MAASKSNIKTGLLLIIVGIIITIVTSIFNFLATFIPNMGTIGGFIILIANVFEILGILMCGTSYSTGFRYAFYCLLANLVISLVVALIAAIPNATDTAFVKALATTCGVIKGILETLFVILVIMGCGESSYSGKVKSLAFTTLLTTIAWFILRIFCDNFIYNLTSDFEWLKYLLSALLFAFELGYNILFFVLLFKTYKTC